MSKNNPRIEERLDRLGAWFSKQPPIVDRVMSELRCVEPVRTSIHDRGRILSMLLKPQSLVAAVAVLAVVVFGLRPWATDRESGQTAWWIAPPSAWAAELQATLDEASQQEFSCQEQFINLVAGALPSTSSTTSTLFVAGDRYRRDTYDQGHLRESQWYVQGADGLTMTGVHYKDKTYVVTHDPKALHKGDHPLARVKALARQLDASGRKVGTARIEDRDAVEFEIAAKKVDAQDDDAVVHVWLDQTTKMPLKITREFAGRAGDSPVIGMIYVQDHFDWDATLPAGTFEPEIPAGYTKVESE